ncbi:MAG: c-type cytochrome [Bryobacteraceae bacterium]
MRTLFLAALITAALCLSAGRAAAADAASVERGRYLAVEVAKCGMCHTPKDEKGEPDKEKWFKGSVLDFAPLTPGSPGTKGWHKTAQDLTPGGSLWKKWGEAAMVNFLVTGKNPRGNPADVPMPAYTMTKQDAEAIVDYLKTLK